MHKAYGLQMSIFAAMKSLKMTHRHVLICECRILDENQENNIDAFVNNCLRLDGDTEVIILLLSFMVKDPISPHSGLGSLHATFFKIFLHNLCHGFSIQYFMLRFT